MSSLGKGTGLFNLNNSDHCVGSLFSVEDIFSILEIDKLSVLDFKDALEALGLLQKGNVVDENNLYKHFVDIKKLYSTIPLMKSVSLDECILKQIITRALPGATISQQISYRNDVTNRLKFIDFKVEFNDQVKFIEFDGPSHFYNRYKPEAQNPFDRKHQIEDFFGHECILWPFWIQRCELNVKALFDETTKGYGAIWSSRILFNSFNIPTPGQIIIDTNKQFRAEREDGIGYFYGGDTENRSIPEHPIIKKILNGKKCINEIIPSDITKDKEYWVPPKLWNLL